MQSPIIEKGEERYFDDTHRHSTEPVEKVYNEDMHSQTLLFALILMVAGMGSVFGVFRYLEALRVHNLDIESAMSQTSRVQCNVAWGTDERGGKGVIVFSEGKTRLDYEYTTGSRKNRFSSLLERNSGDMYVWGLGENNVVHFPQAMKRTEIAEKWWNTATLSKCKPMWKSADGYTKLPAGAQITVR